MPKIKTAIVFALCSLSATESVSQSAPSSDIIRRCAADEAACNATIDALITTWDGPREDLQIILSSIVVQLADLMEEAPEASESPAFFDRGRRAQSFVEALDRIYREFQETGRNAAAQRVRSIRSFVSERYRYELQLRR
jgi:hypothetical protein